MNQNKGNIRFGTLIVEVIKKRVSKHGQTLSKQSIVKNVPNMVFVEMDNIVIQTPNMDQRIKQNIHKEFKNCDIGFVEISNAIFTGQTTYPIDEFPKYQQHGKQ